MPKTQLKPYNEFGFKTGIYMNKSEKNILMQLSFLRKNNNINTSELEQTRNCTNSVHLSLLAKYEANDSDRHAFTWAVDIPNAKGC